MKSPDPRKTALDILNQYFESGTPIKTLFSILLDGPGLSNLDRKFAFNIVKGTVRYVIRLDFIISSLAKRQLKDIDPAILNILRMGIFQCQFMDRVPSYSIVDESVKLAKSEKEYAAGFVNAIMRKASSIDNADIFIEGLLSKKKYDQAMVISTRYSYPEWIIRYWMGHFGREKTIRICRYLNRTPGFYLRINKTLAGGSSNFIAGELKAINAVPVNLKTRDLENMDGDFTEIFEPVARYVLPEGEDLLFDQAASISSAAGLERTQLFLDGKITVQDISSQLAVRYFLDPRPGEKILDTCAAPGGKTSYIAELMENKGEIIAIDISDEKLGLLQQNISRMGAGIVKTQKGDSSRKGFLGSDKYNNYFDRIFVDAPCSAFGTISKNPEVKYSKKIEDLERLSKKTLAILNACGLYLKKGGRLVVYTCTLSPVENQDTADRFIKEMGKGYIIEQLENEKLPVKMQLEIMPYYLGSEGGFVSVFKKV